MSILSDKSASKFSSPMVSFQFCNRATGFSGTDTIRVSRWVFTTYYAVTTVSFPPVSRVWL